LPPTRKQLDYVGQLLGWPPEYVKGWNRGELSDAIQQLREFQRRDSVKRAPRTRPESKGSEGRRSA
jgi:hypothetical protein